MSEVTTTKDGLYARLCVEQGHYKCRAYTFTFDTPDNPAMGKWTVVAAGVSDGSAYVRAYEYLFAECIDAGTIVRLTEQEKGEPGQTSLYGWLDARDCTFDVETP